MAIVKLVNENEMIVIIKWSNVMKIVMKWN
jgi:hypothetical protein